MESFERLVTIPNSSVIQQHTNDCQSTRIMTTLCSFKIHFFFALYLCSMTLSFYVHPRDKKTLERRSGIWFFLALYDKILWMHFDIMLQAFERGHNVTLPLTIDFQRTVLFSSFFLSKPSLKVWPRIESLT